MSHLLHQATNLVGQAFGRQTTYDELLYDTSSTIPRGVTGLWGSLFRNASLAEQVITSTRASYLRGWQMLRETEFFKANTAMTQLAASARSTMMTALRQLGPSLDYGPCGWQGMVSARQPLDWIDYKESIGSTASTALSCAKQRLDGMWRWTALAVGLGGAAAIAAYVYWIRRSGQRARAAEEAWVTAELSGHGFCDDGPAGEFPVRPDGSMHPVWRERRMGIALRLAKEVKHEMGGITPAMTDANRLVVTRKIDEVMTQHGITRRIDRARWAGRIRALVFTRLDEELEEMEVLHTAAVVEAHARPGRVGLWSWLPWKFGWTRRKFAPLK